MRKDQSQGDGAIVVVSGNVGGRSDKDIRTAAANQARTREQISLAYAVGLMDLVVVITHMNTTPAVTPFYLRLQLLLITFFSFQLVHPGQWFNSIRQNMSELMTEIGYEPSSVIYVPMGASFGENITEYQYVNSFAITLETIKR